MAVTQDDIRRLASTVRLAGGKPTEVCARRMAEIAELATAAESLGLTLVVSEDCPPDKVYLCNGKPGCPSGS